MAEVLMPSLDRLRQLLDYCPDTGVLTWKAVPLGIAHGRSDRDEASIAKGWNRLRAGVVAGSPQQDGRLRVTVDRQAYYAHRLAWLLHFGVEPDGIIDHLNGNPADNRIENLRIATYAENSRNKRVAVRASTGHRGIYLRRGRFRVITRVRGKTITIGTFDTMAEAIMARQHFDANHGFTERHLQQHLG